MKRKLHPRLTALVCLLLLSFTTTAATPDWSLYRQILVDHVEPGTIDDVAVNVVNYSAMAEDPRFPVLVDQIRTFDVTRLANDQEKLAFYINAYNILTIQLILDHWPLKSIRDIGSFFSGPWDIVMLKNADGDLTLDDIEHVIIRSIPEPRIHFAVNCASVSCPDLRREPYTAAQLDEQLEEQARTFLTQEGKGILIEGKTARVSRIFRWYGEDFDDVGGVEGYVQGLINQPHQRVKANLPYNWSLNGR